ncbi:hypothetical protein M5K25_017618 [Dendrobium thyrsiflorum]|uniref:Tubulin-folding cofactor D ARM repeats domain-containing protein n=1 Tax=Dendrobium thyrsiflorum TaxID=117978 RepID=A0ABD0UUV7_DENTH
MAGKKVEILEGEIGQLKSDLEKKFSDFQNQISFNNERMEEKFVVMEEMLKKLLEVKIAPATSEARETIGGHGRRGNPNMFRGRENPEVEILEGEDDMPPLEPLSREERSTGFIEWTFEFMLSWTEDNINQFRILGIVEALASIFKVGERTILIDAVDKTWANISHLIQSSVAARNSLLRKYIVKLSQRIGLICLPHRSTTWRYMARTSSLGKNILLNAAEIIYPCSNGQQVVHVNDMSSAEILEEDNIDVPEIVEEIIELLLSGLKDSIRVLMAAKKVDALEERLGGEISQIKATVEDGISSVEDKFSNLEEMVKKVLNLHNQTAASEAKVLACGNINFDSGRDDHDVEILEGEERRPTIEPIQREELGRSLKLARWSSHGRNAACLFTRIDAYLASLLHR